MVQSKNMYVWDTTNPTSPPPPPPKKMSNRDPLIFTKSRFRDYETPHNSETLALCRWDPL